MKLLHLSDLHLGKRVNEFSLLEDQAYILNQILKIAAEERPDAVLLAGDLYDRSVPPAEAVQLFDDFLCRLAGDGQEVFLISGNHDSAERIAFGGRLMDRSGIHVSPVYDGSMKPWTLEDGYGPLDVYLLPFVKPAQVRRFFPERRIETYTEALEAVLEGLPVHRDRRNVLVTHQFVTGASRCESEEISVGGTDQVDASVFGLFDYVALGHLHGPQSMENGRIRYCGTPLKYSFSEVRQQKSATVVELGEKGTLSLRAVPLFPLHDMREIKGSYLEVTEKSFYEGTDCADYLHVTLTDEEDVPDAVGRLRVIYPNLMKLDYDNRRTRMEASVPEAENVEDRTPSELFQDFYEKQNGQPVSEEQLSFLQKLIESIWEDER